MNPVAFTIFGQEIMWYGIIITAAMVLSVSLISKSAESHGFKGDDFLDIAIFALPVAVICARAYYVIFNLPMYDNFWKMIDIRQGGLAIHGGLIGGVTAGFIVAKAKKMNFFKAADVVAPFVALAQSIGRWGNYINQEAYGRPTDLPWAILIDGVRVHPTFLYESIWDFLVFGILLKKLKDKEYDGQVMALYLILYSAGRFFIEGLRTDSLMLGHLRAAQIASLLMILWGFLLLAFRKSKGIGNSYMDSRTNQSNYHFAKEVKANLEKNKAKQQMEIEARSQAPDGPKEKNGKKE